ncbi:MAG: 23S rRNA (guanosine(2251)-2'-O)-methyltransferase RlmB [Clostridiales bacterium]|nr:23S rRNA (guanosine(2251)-2'-O)-methyltransferase RlmB [Clostridiales bacterium]
MENLIFGRNPVIEALKSGRELEKVLLQKGAEGSAKKIEAMTLERGIQLRLCDKSELDRICGGGSHQGVAAFGSSYKYYEIEDLLADAEAAGRQPLLVMLDGIEDPHNLGAILRTADCAGACGIIVPKRRSAGLSEIVAKSSAGAIEYVKTAKVANLAQTIDKLKEQGFWVAACDMDGSNYTATDLTGPLVLVVGGEGSGVSRIVREKCDFIVSIPMEGHVNSLNASNAAAILLYEIHRQRTLKAKK